MWIDTIRFARVGLDFDGLYRLRCPKCEGVKVRISEDASSATCEDCREVFSDGSLVLTVARRSHCHLCHLLAACVMSRGVKRCVMCHTAWVKAGNPDQDPRPLWAIRYSFEMSWLRVPSVSDFIDALAQAESVRVSERSRRS